MLFLYFMVGVALAIPEVIFVQNIPQLKKITESNAIVEIMFSLVFGFGIGFMMGIEGGVTFAVGNVFSTIITKFIYNFKIMDKIIAFKQWRHDAMSGISSAMQTVTACLQAMKVLLNVIFFPFVLIHRLSERAKRAS